MSISRSFADEQRRARLRATGWKHLRVLDEWRWLHEPCGYATREPWPPEPCPGCSAPKPEEPTDDVRQLKLL